MTTQRRQQIEAALARARQTIDGISEDMRLAAGARRSTTSAVRPMHAVASGSAPTLEEQLTKAAGSAVDAVLAVLSTGAAETDDVALAKALDAIGAATGITDPETVVAFLTDAIAGQAGTLLRTATAHGFVVREDAAPGSSLLTALDLARGENPLAKTAVVQDARLANASHARLTARLEGLRRETTEAAAWADRHGYKETATMAKASAADMESLPEVFATIYANPQRVGPTPPTAEPPVDRRPTLMTLRDRQLKEGNHPGSELTSREIMHAEACAVTKEPSFSRPRSSPPPAVA